MVDDLTMWIFTSWVFPVRPPLSVVAVDRKRMACEVRACRTPTVLVCRRPTRPALAESLGGCRAKSCRLCSRRKKLWTLDVWWLHWYKMLGCLSKPVVCFSRLLLQHYSVKSFGAVMVTLFKCIICIWLVSLYVLLAWQVIIKAFSHVTSIVNKASFWLQRLLALLNPKMTPTPSITHCFLSNSPPKSSKCGIHASK